MSVIAPDSTVFPTEEPVTAVFCSDHAGAPSEAMSPSEARSKAFPAAVPAAEPSNWIADHVHDTYAAAVPVEPPAEETMMDFRDELQHLINRHSRENGSDTPDFILAFFLGEVLEAFDATLRRRSAWRGHLDKVVAEPYETATLEEALPAAFGSSETTSGATPSEAWEPSNLDSEQDSGHVTRSGVQEAGWEPKRGEKVQFRGFPDLWGTVRHVVKVDDADHQAFVEWNDDKHAWVDVYKIRPAPTPQASEGTPVIARPTGEQGERNG